MLSPEVINSLKNQKAQLLRELAGIDQLLAESNEPTAATKHLSKRDPVQGEGQPKGGENWETYVRTILKILGGKGKAIDVFNYARKANPRMDGELIANAVRGKLSKLSLNGTIGANRTDVKSEGYEYFIKQ